MKKKGKVTNTKNRVEGWEVEKWNDEGDCPGPTRARVPESQK